MRGEGIAASDESVQAAAFRRLANEHLEAGYRLAYAILGNPAEAQDATHDAFVQAWRKWHTLRDPDSFEAWFDRIVANTCKNRLTSSARRHTRTLENAIETVGSGIETPRADPMGQALDRVALAVALATLSPDHRVVVALRYYRDLSVDQIAARLGLRPGTVRSRLHYATRRLHAALVEADEREVTR